MPFQNEETLEGFTKIEKMITNEEACQTLTGMTIGEALHSLHFEPVDLKKNKSKINEKVRIKQSSKRKNNIKCSDIFKRIALRFLEKCENWTRERFLAELNWYGITKQLVGARTEWKGWEKIQEEFMKAFLDFNIIEIIAICTRRGSKTLLCAICVAYCLLTIRRIKIGTLSGSLDEAGELRKYLDIIFEPFDRYWHIFRNKYNMDDKYLWNEARYYTFANTIRSTRSHGVDILIIDEAVLVNEDVLFAALGMDIASKICIIRMLTTPLLDANNKIVKQEYDIIERENPSDKKIFKWTWKDLKYINKKAIEEKRRLMPIEQFNAEFNCIWASSKGKVYIPTEVNRSIIGQDHLMIIFRKIEELKREEREKIIRKGGIDWGTVHNSVIVSGFKWKGINDTGNSDNDVLIINRMKVWKFEQNKDKDKVIQEMVEYCIESEIKEVWSEENAESSSDNYRLEKKLIPLGIKLIRSTFGRKPSQEDLTESERSKDKTKRVEKGTYINNSIKRFNRYTIRITENLYELINQIREQCYDAEGKVKKQEWDDAWDSFLHLNQSYEMNMDKYELIQRQLMLNKVIC